MRPISGNRLHKHELSPYDKGIINGKAFDGKSVRQIASELQQPCQTVQDTIQKQQIRENGKSLPRSGCPKQVTEYDKRRILLLTRTNPRMTYEEMLEALPMSVSKSTYYRLLKEHHIKK